MPSAGFEPAIPATKRPQTYVLDHTATGIGIMYITVQKFSKNITMDVDTHHAYAYKHHSYQMPSLDPVLSHLKSVNTLTNFY
jgi:hypothetical protein